MHILHSLISYLAGSSLSLSLLKIGSISVRFRRDPPNDDPPRPPPPPLDTACSVERTLSGFTVRNCPYDDFAPPRPPFAPPPPPLSSAAAAGSAAGTKHFVSSSSLSTDSSFSAGFAAPSFRDDFDDELDCGADDDSYPSMGGMSSSSSSSLLQWEGEKEEGVLAGVAVMLGRRLEDEWES